VNPHEAQRDLAKSKSKLQESATLELVMRVTCSQFRA